MALASLTLNSMPAILVLELEERWVGVWEPTCALPSVVFGGVESSFPAWFGGGVAIVFGGGYYHWTKSVYIPVPPLTSDRSHRGSNRSVIGRSVVVPNTG